MNGQPSILSHAVPQTDLAWVRQTRLYKHALQLRSEVSEHKWYESERAGADIGWDRAAVSYHIHLSLSHTK